MIYLYRAEDGHEIEVDRPMNRAPCFGARIRRNGRVYQRVMTQPMVAVSQNIHSRSHQLPSWYGFRDHAAADAYSRSKGRKPNEKDRNLIAARNAERAGAKGEFDRQGRPIASTRSGVAKHVKRGRDKGDQITFEGVRT